MHIIQYNMYEIEMHATSQGIWVYICKLPLSTTFACTFMSTQHLHLPITYPYICLHVQLCLNSNMHVCTLWQFKIAMENFPFIVSFPMNNGDFQ